MKDILGNTILEGDKILWMCGSHGAGSSVYTVDYLTPKRIRASITVGGSMYIIDPANAVVVTRLLHD